MKALVKNELRLTRKLLLIWMGIVLILCGFAYFEYLSLKESLNELTGLISNFPKILKAMFGVSGDLTSALGWYGCMYYWVTMLTNSYAVYLGVSCVAKEQRRERQNIYLQNQWVATRLSVPKQLPVYVICLHLRYSAGYVIILPPFYR